MACMLAGGIALPPAGLAFGQDSPLDPAPNAILEGETEAGASWALLPIVGFSPDTSVVLGLKFRESDFLREGMVIDVEGSYAFLEQQRYTVSVDDEHLLGSVFSFRAQGAFELDPSLEFFGLGADSAGPDESSNHLEQRYGGRVMAGFWPTDSVNVSFGARWDEVEIGQGRSSDSASTADVFPNLVGLDGGSVRGLIATIEFDQYPEDFLRMRGARVRAEIEEVSPWLDNDFDFTRIEADASFVQDLYRRRLALGLRVRGEILEGSGSDIPFFELPTLGGASTLRGFFPDRFRGKGSLMANLELRALLFGFDFFDIWDVTIGTAAFADAGRVFTSTEELRSEWDQGYELSYGGGIRFILGEAILARVDVGFSDEETGQVFLRFGQMF